MESPNETYNAKTAILYNSAMWLIQNHQATRSIILESSELSPITTIRNSNIINLGCGTGKDIGLLAQRFPKARITGVDASDAMLRICKEQVQTSKVRLLRGDFNKGTQFVVVGKDLGTESKMRIELQKESSDLVCSFGAVSEYGEVPNIIQTIYDLLKPGGYFLNFGIKRNAINRRIIGKVWSYDPLGKDALKEHCTNIGFEDIQDINIPLRYFIAKYLKFAILARK